MRTRVLGNILLLLFVAAPLLAIDSGDATVYVYRPSRLPAMARRPSIYIDGVEIARLGSGMYLKFEVAPGRHLITSATYVEGNPFLNFESGKEYFFRLKIGSAAKGVFGWAEIKLQEVPQQQAVKELEKLKQGKVTPPKPKSP
jgi:hypothetical protein